MGGLFPKWSDDVLRFALGVVALVAIGVPLVLMLYVRTPYNQDRMSPIDQPVQFDHRHHVRDDAIPCLYCHANAERSASAGIPPVELCMGCHAQVWNQSGLLAPVRDSYYANAPLAWNRVHRLPDFVFFNHSVHVKRGIDCAECHGDVSQMPLVYRTKSLTMGFCLDCHRHPEQHVPGYIDAIAPRRSGSQPQEMSSIATNQLTTCTACHR